MDDNKSSIGIGLTSGLTLIFIALKLAKVINWSWVWVLSPIWISILIVVFIALIYYIWG